jgi:hypothetical protein
MIKSEKFPKFINYCRERGMKHFKGISRLGWSQSREVVMGKYISKLFVLFMFLFVMRLPVQSQIGWNTFLGSAGTDNAGVYYGNEIAVDSSGNIYVMGHSDTTWGSPVRAYSGNLDAFVAKLNSSGTLLWNTFLGSSSEDQSSGITVDSSGNVYITGNSWATWNSPVRAFSGSHDAFIAKLDSDGGLLWNTFLGSTIQDNGLGIAVSSTGNIYLAGSCNGTWGSPVQAHSGFYDGFVAKLSSSGALVWNTFFGSSVLEGAVDIALDSSENAYISGYGLGTWGSPIRAYSGGDDGFVVKLNSSGTRIWNTFLGGVGTDHGYGIYIDSSSNIFLTGKSTATWGSPLRAHSGAEDAFAVKLNSSGDVLWNTFLGGAGSDFGYGIAVDSLGNIHLSGSSNATWGSPQQAYSGNYDAFAAKLDSSGGLVKNTFFGQSGLDHGAGLAVDSSGNIFISGYSAATWGSPVRAYSGGNDVFVAKLSWPSLVTSPHFSQA